jgi:excisionase family DNA binding protein
MDKRLLNVPELCEYLSLPKASIYTMVSLGKLPGVVRLGRALRFEKSAIDGWVNAQAATQSNAQAHR